MSDHYCYELSRRNQTEILELKLGPIWLLATPHSIPLDFESSCVTNFAHLTFGKIPWQSFQFKKFKMNFDDAMAFSNQITSSNSCAVYGDNTTHHIQSMYVLQMMDGNTFTVLMTRDASTWSTPRKDCNHLAMRLLS